MMMNPFLEQIGIAAVKSAVTHDSVLSSGKGNIVTGTQA
jgi:hypothetical protein